MLNIYFGNAKDDGQETRGWIIGDFVPKEMRYSNKVEVKYGTHSKGEARNEWAADERRTTLFILQSGRFTMHFRDRKVMLDQPGDYVIWGPGVDHRWEALDDSIGITVRWAEK